MTSGKAVTFRGTGGVEVIELRAVSPAAPGPGEVLVEIAAAGLNRADLLQRRGFYPAPRGAPADIPGLEFSGTVAALGDGASAWKVGDRVMGIAGGGAMATHIVAHERAVVAVPEGMSLTDAAAVPEVFFTAYDALFSRGRLGLGEVVLLHAVGSGVGTAALQLSRAAGARTIGTSRTASKLERCRELGLDEAVEVSEKRFASQVRELSGGRGADVIVDLVGAAYLEENVAALAPLGRLVVVGLLGGVGGTLPLGALLAKRATVVGTVLRSRPLEEKIALCQEFSRCVLPLFASGAVRPVVEDVMPMADVAAAHQRLEQNATFGKLVLAW